MIFGSGLRRIQGGKYDVNISPKYCTAVGRDPSWSVPAQQRALVAERAVLYSDPQVCMNIPFIVIVHHAYETEEEPRKETYPLSSLIHVPVLLCAIRRIRAIATSWNNADTATAYPPRAPSGLTEQHPSEAGTNVAIESNTRANDASEVVANCITMNGMSARGRQDTSS